MTRMPARIVLPRTPLLCVVSAALCLSAACMRQASGQETTSASACGQPGPHQVVTMTFDWADPARAGRRVPAKLYVPASTEAPCPVIIFSHGLGGTREGYEYLGRHWASHGYVSVHIQHVGSDDSAWRGQRDTVAAMRRAAADPRNAIERPRDVRLAIDQLERLNTEEGELRGRLDLAHIGMAGHSFGAHTTLWVAGQPMLGPAGLQLPMGDPRVTAAIAMSPAPPPRASDAAIRRAFGQIRLPCMHMTGTEDQSIITSTTPAQRRIPYDCCSGSDQYLCIYSGGDHMVYSGRGRLADRPRDPAFRQHTLELTTAFWDAYLRNDPAARTWLDGGAAAASLGADGTLEQKHPAPQE